MHILCRHLFQLFLLILLTSYSTFALAIDCKKAKSEIEKLICKPNNDKDAAYIFDNEDVILLDNEFNTLYNKIISGLDGEKKEEFKKSIQDLIKVRDGCINVYGLSVKSMNGYRNNDRQFHQFHCLKTFYKSIINSMKDLEKFKIPSKDEYMDVFFGIRKHIHYTKDVKDKTGIYITGEEIDNIEEKFLFFKNHPFAIYHDVHSLLNDGDDPNPYRHNDIFYYTFDKNNKNIKFIGHVPENKRHYPISKITEINGSLYIPHGESVASIFDIAGWCNKDVCGYNDIYVKYKPERLLHFKDLDGIKDTLFVFSDTYVSTQPLKHPPFTDEQKCYLDIIKKYSEKTINLEFVNEYSSKKEKVKYIAIKSSNAEKIRKIANSRCDKYLKDVN